MRHAELDTRHTILLQATVKIARFLVAVIRIGKEAIEGSPFRKKPGITDRIFPGIRRIRQKCRVFQAIVLDGTVKPAGADILRVGKTLYPSPIFQTEESFESATRLQFAVDENGPLLYERLIP